MLRVGIIGASGFTGAELLRLVAQHPQFELAVATADSQAGVAAATLYPGLAGAYPGLVFEAFDPDQVDGLDVVFLGLPHEASLALAPQLVGRVGCVVDLSAAYRLKDAAQYPAYYGFEHDQPALLAEAVYGLPELHRDELKGARLIATPGCYVTAATLALRPLVESGVIETQRCHRRRRLGRDRRRPQDRPRLHLHDRRRELHRLRPAVAPPHPRDGAGDRRPAAVHAPPGADEPRHPGHVLRPAGER